MSKRMVSVFVAAAAAALAGCAGTSGASAPADADWATQQFAKLRSLQGDWVASGADSSMPGANLHYEVTSGGSAVVEHIFPGSDHSMVSVYTLDNGRLVMTHYCALGNQPHMVASPAEGGAIEFRCDGAGNTKSEGDAHMHRGVFRIADGSLRAEWTLYEKGEAGGTVVMDMVRAN